MTRKTKLSYTECKAELQLFAAAANEEYGTHAFAAGYFQAMLAEVLAELPKAAQTRLIDSIRRSPVLQAK